MSLSAELITTHRIFLEQNTIDLLLKRLRGKLSRIRSLHLDPQTICCQLSGVLNGLMTQIFEKFCDLLIGLAVSLCDRSSTSLFLQGIQLTPNFGSVDETPETTPYILAPIGQRTN